MNGGRRKVENWNFLCYHLSELLGWKAAAFSRGVARKHAAFWTRFRDFVAKLSRSPCLLFSTRSPSVSEVLWWLWNTNFHMIRHPIRESFHYELFRKPGSGSEPFESSFFWWSLFPMKSFRNYNKPRTARRITLRMQFHMKLLEKRGKLIKCFVMHDDSQETIDKRIFPYTTLAVQKLFKLGSSKSKFKFMQI